MYKNWIRCLYITLLYIPFAVHAASLPEDHLIETPATEELDSYSPEEKEDDEISDLSSESRSANPIENRDEAFSSESENTDNIEERSKFDQFQETIFFEILDPSLDDEGSKSIQLSEKKHMDLLIKILPFAKDAIIKFPNAYYSYKNFYEFYKNSYLLKSYATDSIGNLDSELALLHQVSHREIKESDYTGELAALYPSLTTISTNLSEMNYFLPPNFFQLVDIVLSMHMLLHYKELSKMQKIGFFNFFRTMSRKILFPFLKSNIRESLLLCYYKFIVSAVQFLSNKGLVNINDEALKCLSYTFCKDEPLRLQDIVHGATVFTRGLLNHKSLMGDKPWYKLYTPLKNLYLMRNHNFNPTLKKIELSLNMLSYTLSLGSRIFNKYGIVRSGTIRNALESAQQQKDTIEAYSNELSAVCHALQTGYFVPTCCPQDWQKLVKEYENHKDVFQIILDYTYQEGTDYKLVKSATDQKFSFFDAPDDDQAEVLCVKRIQDNLLAKSTAHVATSLLAIFAGYSLLSYARKSKN